MRARGIMYGIRIIVMLIMLTDFGCHRSVSEASHDSGMDVKAVSDDDANADADADTDADGSGDADADADGDSDIYVNPDGGHLIWAKRAGGQDHDDGFGIASTSDDSIIITGYFSDVSTWGKGEPNEAQLTENEHCRRFIANYSKNGNFNWVNCLEGSLPVVAATEEGGAIVTGKYKLPIIFDFGGPNETTLEPFGQDDIFIAKYNNDGTFSWARSAGSTDTDLSEDITILNDGSFIITGIFNNNCILGKGEQNETTLQSINDGADILIARYLSDGSLEWAKSAGGIYTDWGMGIASLNDGSTIITGIFSTEATFGKGEKNETVLSNIEGIYADTDIFIARYDIEGALLWAKSAGGADPDIEAFEIVKGISAYEDGSTVIIGEFPGSITFGKDEPNEITFESVGKIDIFIARYNPDGTLAWASRTWGEESGHSMDIIAIPGGESVITGYFWDTTIFGEGEANETSLTSWGYSDLFIAKYSPDGLLAWAKQAGSIKYDEWIFINTLSDGSSVVTGYFYDVATFGKNEKNETKLTSDGETDIFIARFSP